VGGGVKKSPFETNREFSFFDPPDTEDVEAFRAFRPEVDPTIGFRQGEQVRELKRSLNNPLGSYTTPEMREQQFRRGNEQIASNAGMEQRAGQFDVNRLRLGQLGGLADLTKPVFANTKDSGFTSVNRPGFGESFLSGFGSSLGGFLGGSGVKKIPGFG
jgi:hypothetical protein